MHVGFKDSFIRIIVQVRHLHLHKDRKCNVSKGGRNLTFVELCSFGKWQKQWLEYERDLTWFRSRSESVSGGDMGRMKRAYREDIHKTTQRGGFDQSRSCSISPRSRTVQSRAESGYRENVDANPRHQGRVLQIFSSQRRCVSYDRTPLPVCILSGFHEWPENKDFPVDQRTVRFRRFFLFGLQSLGCQLFAVLRQQRANAS